MPMSACVTNMNGQIVAEKRGGQHRVLTADPLGSVIDVRDASGTQLASYNFWPYGGLRTSTGAIANPWRFCGTWGYYFDGSDYYVRARYYRPQLTRWLTADPLWPVEAVFSYGNLQPQFGPDFFGTRPLQDAMVPPGCPRRYPMSDPPPGSGTIKGAPASGSTCAKWNEFIYSYCNKCSRNMMADPTCGFVCSTLAAWYYKACKFPGRECSGGERWHPWPQDGRVGPSYPPRPVGIEPIGGGVADFDRNWGSPREWAYGNCCGENRRCSCRSKAIDCLDRACRAHDDSIPTENEFLDGRNHRKFCDALLACRCSNDYPVGSLDHRNCEAARHDMMVTFCLLGVIIR